jgi:hypothetical protein
LAAARDVDRVEKIFNGSIGPMHGVYSRRYYKGAAAAEMVMAGARGTGSPTYNAFRFRTMAAAMRDPAFAGLSFKFGREYSPVLYVKGPEAQLRTFMTRHGRTADEKWIVPKDAREIVRGRRGNALLDATGTAVRTKVSPFRGQLRLWWD